MTTLLATDEEITERVRECYENGETIDWGGVIPETVAADLEIATNTARDRLRALAEKGVLERDYGLEDGTQRTGYRPAEGHQ